MTQTLLAYTLEGVFGRDDRVIWMDGRPHPSEYAEHTWDGFSTGKHRRQSADHHDDAHEVRGHPAQRRREQRQRDDDRALHPPRRLPHAGHDRRRPRLSRGAVHPHLAVGADVEHHARPAIHLRGRGRSGRPSAGLRPALPARHQAGRVREEPRPAVRGDAGRQGNHLSRVRAEAATDARGHGGGEAAKSRRRNEAAPPRHRRGAGACRCRRRRSLGAQQPTVRALTEPWPEIVKVDGIEILHVQRGVYMLVGGGRERHGAGRRGGRHARGCRRRRARREDRRGRPSPDEEAAALSRQHQRGRRSASAATPPSSRPAGGDQRPGWRRRRREQPASW